MCVAGYDACAHMSEETKNADVVAPWGILLSIIVSAVAGWLYIIALLFSIQVWTVPTSPCLGTAIFL